MTNHLQTQHIDTQAGKEISLIDIILFLRGAWKIIAITSLLGIVSSSIFLRVTPDQYEAVANIAMAYRIPADKNPLWVNIEEPQALINRMSLPTSWGEQVRSACGWQAESDQAAQIAKTIKLTIPKGVINIVELKVTRPSAEIAKICAVSVFESISASQSKVIEFVKAADRARLAKLDMRLAQDKALLVKVGESKNMVSPTYYLLLSEIRALEDEREKILMMIHMNAVQATSLQSPVYVAGQPIYPKKALSLMAGFLGGLFLGVLIALARQILPKLKAQLLEAVR